MAAGVSVTLFQHFWWKSYIYMNDLYGYVCRIYETKLISNVLLFLILTSYVNRCPKITSPYINYLTLNPMLV